MIKIQEYYWPHDICVEKQQPQMQEPKSLIGIVE